MPSHKPPSAMDALHRTSTLTPGTAPTGSSDVGESNSFAQSQLKRQTHAPGGSEPPNGLGKGKYDFGRLGSMVTFQERLGDLIGVVVGSPGDTLSIEIGAEVSVEGIVLGIKLSGSASRTAEGFEMAAKYDLELGVGEVGDSLKLALSVGMDASGDTARECANLMGLGLEQTLRERQFHAEDLLDGDFWAGIGKDIGMMSATGGAWWLFAAPFRVWGDAIADALWGRDYSRYVLQDMDEDDEVSRTVGAGFKGEAEGLSAGIDYEHRDVIGADDGELEKHGEDDLTISAGYKHSAPPLEFSGSLSAVIPIAQDRKAKATLKIKTKSKEKLSPDLGVQTLARNGIVDVIKGLLTQGGKIDLGWIGKVVDGATKALDAAVGLAGGVSDLTAVLSVDSNGKVKLKLLSETGVDIDSKQKVVGVKVELALQRTVFETEFDVGPLKPAKTVTGPTADASSRLAPT